MTSEWRDGAACAGLNTSAVFYPDKPAGRYPNGRDPYAAAKAVCAGCPVRPECAAAGADDPYGVWGGVDPDQRRSAVRRERRARAAPTRNTRQLWENCGAHRGPLPTVSPAGLAPLRPNRKQDHQ